MRRIVLASPLALAALAVALGSLPACVSTVSDNVELAASPREDKDYAAKLTQATRESDVIKDFETRYSTSATYLSPAFKAAFAKRFEALYHRSDLQFAEAGTKAAFFVTINAADDEAMDISNPKHWTIQLKEKGEAVQPVLVKRLNDKERWRPFFPAINDWSQEYLVVFDLPAVNANSPELVEKTSLTLALANADGTVNLTW